MHTDDLTPAAADAPAVHPADSPDAATAAEAAIVTLPPSPHGDGPEGGARGGDAPRGEAGPDAAAGSGGEALSPAAAASSSGAETGEPGGEGDPGAERASAAVERPRWNTPVARRGGVRADPVAPEPEAEARLTFRPEPGVYTPPLTLEISADVPGVEIRWSDDGTEPTAASPLYTEPLLIGRGCTVAARAYWRGAAAGPLARAGYDLRAPEWKELEPEERADAVPHNLIGARHFAWGWAVAAASRRGKLHAHRGLWREDAFALLGKEPWSVIAVADGAGSARLARVGSQLACETAAGHLGDMLPAGGLHAADTGALKEELADVREVLAEAARLALAAVRDEAAARGEPLEALACTLLLAVHCPWRGRQLVACLQVGDGAIALLDGAGELTLLGTPDHGAHSSETRFLTTRGVEETLAHRTSFSLKEELRALAVMTDGVSDDFFPEEKRLGELFTGRAIGGMARRDGTPVDGVLHCVVGDERPHRALSRWLEYERKGSSDDRTLVLLWREP